jgi:hypothetical protein
LLLFHACCVTSVYGLFYVGYIILIDLIVILKSNVLPPLVINWMTKDDWCLYQLPYGKELVLTCPFNPRMESDSNKKEFL